MQALAVAGLIGAPATMQPQAFAARMAAQQPGRAGAGALRQ